jgi:hypothetical protein
MEIGFSYPQNMKQLWQKVLDSCHNHTVLDKLLTISVFHFILKMNYLHLKD